jgi:hypothetical protein
MPDGLWAWLNWIVGRSYMPTAAKAIAFFFRRIAKIRYGLDDYNLLL